MNNFSIIIRPESLALTSQRSLVGVIYFQINEHQFPDGNWSDFIVILAHWVLSSSKMKDSSVDSVRFGFMDGPYELLAKRKDTDRWILFAVDRGNKKEEKLSETLSSSEIIKTIQNAALKVLSFCKEQNLVSPNLDEIHGSLS